MQDEKLIIKILKEAYQVLGVRFIKCEFRSLLKPYLQQRDRTDMNYGSWTGRSGDRPLVLVKKHENPRYDVLQISGRWLERCGIDPDEAARKFQEAEARDRQRARERAERAKELAVPNPDWWKER